MEWWVCTAASAWLVGCFVQLIYRLRYSTPLLTDDLIYHLSIPAHWLQHGWNTPFTAWFHEAAPGYSPMLVERLAAILMLPAHNEVWARWVQLPFQFGIAILTYLLLRSLRVRIESAGLTAASTLVLKPFLGESLSCHNDLALTCFFLWTLYGMVRSAQEQFRVGWTRIITGSFLMLATKYVGLIYVIALGIAIIVLYLRRNEGNPSTPSKRGSPSSNAIRILLILLTGALGLHTYIANWRNTGNPVFPAEVRVGTTVIFEGIYAAHEVRDYSISLRSLFNLLLDPQEAYTLSPVSGSVAAAASALAILFWIIRFRSQFSLIVVGVLPAWLLTVYGVFVPFGEPRLIFPIYSLLWMAPTVLLNLWPTETPRRRAIATSLVLTLAIAACVEFNRPEHMLTLLTILGAALGPLLILGAINLLARQRYRPLVYSSLTGVVAVALLSYVYAEAYTLQYDRQRSFEHGYGDLGRAWSWIDEQTREHPAVIAGSGTPIHYPLYGRRLQNDVRYVHIHPQNFPTFHEYVRAGIRPSEGGSAIHRCRSLFRSRKDVKYWLEQIRLQQVDLLFLVREGASGQFPIEADWAAMHDQTFKLVFDSADVRIYKINDNLAP